jgi:hypothetical protein
MKNAHKQWLIYGLVAALIALPSCAFAQSATPSDQKALDAQRHQQRDFDLEIGTWRTHLKRLMHPLTGSATWVEYDGTTVVQRVWGGRANLVELEADGANGHIEALSLRLYNPESKQWSLNFSNSASGLMGTPTVGEFKNGRGEFFDQETLGPRTILVRFVILAISSSLWHFEQSFSDDGGSNWEINWIADDTRIASAVNEARK